MGTVHLPPPDPDDSDGAFVADLLAGRRPWVLWPEVLAMAVRDRATAVRFHTQRTDGPSGGILAYVVDRTEYELVPPPEAEYRTFLDAARKLVAPGRLTRWLERLTGRATVGRARLVAADGGETDWCGVVWTAGGVSGADFYRLTPVPAVPPVGTAEVSAAG